MEILREAISQLDHKDDSHWTSDGKPRMDVVSGLAGQTVTRKELDELFPGFVRKADGEAAEAVKAAAQPKAAAVAPSADDVDPVEELRATIAKQRAVVQAKLDAIETAKMEHKREQVKLDGLLRERQARALTSPQVIQKFLKGQSQKIKAITTEQEK